MDANDILRGHLLYQYIRANHSQTLFIGRFKPVATFSENTSQVFLPVTIGTNSRGQNNQGVIRVFRLWVRIYFATRVTDIAYRFHDPPTERVVI